MLKLSVGFGIIMFVRNIMKTRSEKEDGWKVKAALYSSSDNQELEFGEIGIPRIGKREVFIRVRAASLNPVDYKIKTSKLPFVRWFFLHTVGRDFSGVIMEAGSSVTKFKIGDEVYGNAKGGSLQQYTIANENHIALKPNKLSFAESAALGLAGATSLQAIRYWGELSKNKTVLVIGASGGCGSLGVQLLKHYECKVYGVCSNRNAKLAKEQGRDVVIDYTKPDYLNDLKDAKFDLIYDTVTSMEDPNQEPIYKPFLKQDGKYVAINGSFSDFLRGILKKLKLNLERESYHCHLLDWNTEDLKTLAYIADCDEIKPMISHKFSLNLQNVQEAFDLLRSRRVIGKIVFEI
jgi:NADPH:quinone reductase-like Zn-dependent oxidoreductase